MRNLQTGDLFELVRLINKIGIKEELKEVAMKIDENSSQKQAGFEIIFSLIEKCAEKNSERAFYELLSKPFECSIEEVEKIDPLDLVENILAIASVEKWKSFLKLAIR